MPDRRRVLFVLPSLGGGGAERAVVILLRHLNRNGFEPHLALLDSTGPYLNELPDDLTVHHLGVRHVRYAIPPLVRLMRRLRPQAAVSSLVELNMAMAAAVALMREHPKLFLREDTSVSRQFNSQFLRPPRRLFQRLYTRADKVICVADYVLNDLADNFHIPRSKLVRIYNPVDVERVRQMAAEASNPYADAPDIGARPRFVAVGRLAKVKGFDILLEAMARARRELPQAELVILGEGPLEAELKRQAQALGLGQAVRFLGFQANPYPYMKHASVCVLSSRYEGLPLVLLEALALGLPVVAADCPGGVREAVAGCPTARLVPSEDAAALAGAMVSVFQAASAAQSKSNVGCASADAPLARFRAQRIAQEYERLLS